MESENPGVALLYGITGGSTDRIYKVQDVGAGA
jgi:hypothetical protein